MTKTAKLDATLTTLDKTSKKTKAIDKTKYYNRNKISQTEAKEVIQTDAKQSNEFIKLKPRDTRNTKSHNGKQNLSKIQRCELCLQGLCLFCFSFPVCL